jgi:sRNA-binding protein
MIPKQDLDAALARLAEAFPQTFVLEKHRPHRPLKVGIAADIRARCPAVERRVLSVVLSVYTRRVMYLQSLVAGAARIDLDGTPAGEVTARDAEYAAAKLAGILASREARRVAAAATNRVARVTRPPPAAVVSPPPAPPAAATPPPATVLKQRPVLRLPAFRRAAQ